MGALRNHGKDPLCRSRIWLCVPLMLLDRGGENAGDPEQTGCRFGIARSSAKRALGSGLLAVDGHEMATTDQYP